MGGEALPLVADVATEEAMSRRQLNILEILVIVNNAGFRSLPPIDSITPEQFEKVYCWGFMGYFKPPTRHLRSLVMVVRLSMPHLKLELLVILILHFIPE